MTPHLGGLGLRKVVEHADVAYYVSWHEAQKTAKEVWEPPAGLPEKYLSQKDASFGFDEMMHAYLVDNSDERDAQRLRRAAQPHACVGLLQQYLQMKMAKTRCSDLETFEPP